MMGAKTIAVTAVDVAVGEITMAGVTTTVVIIIAVGPIRNMVHMAHTVQMAVHNILLQHRRYLTHANISNTVSSAKTVVVMPVATVVQMLGKKPQPLWPTTNNRREQAAVHQSLNWAVAAVAVVLTLF